MLLVDLDQSVASVGAITEGIGSTLGDANMDKNLLYMFERYIDVYGLTIGRWKIYEGDGEHLFIVDTKRDGYYRFDKSCLAKQVVGMPSREPINSAYASG